MKIRHRVKGTRFGRRIAKGKSSESNPTTRRFRAAAKAARSSWNVPLTALDKSYENRSSDELLQQISLHRMQIDDAVETKITKISFSDRSEADSQISQFTSCTNPTFDPVHRIWRSGSILQNEVLAVLAATTELIKNDNGKGSDAEYYAALLTVIEATPAENESRLAAAAYLLGLVARKVDKGVVRKCFSRAHQILERKLDETQSGIALAKIISTLGTILYRQTASIWQTSSNRLSLVKIGMFIMHDKCLVRNAVRHVLRTILIDPVVSLFNDHHPGADGIGEFLIRHMKQCSGNQDVDSLLRLLCLAEIVVCKMSAVLVKNFAELALALISVPDRKLRCAVYRCFQRLMQQQPANAVLPFDINLKIIDILREFPSTVVDPSVLCSWMEALCESHLCLYSKDQAKSVVTLKVSLIPIFQAFDSGNDSVAMTAHKVIVRLVERCVKSNEELANVCVDLCDKAFNPRSTAVWQYVFHTESKIFEICQTAISPEYFGRALKTLAELRQDSYCCLIPDIDLTVGAAIRHIGAENVLRVLPLDLDPENPTRFQFERSWLLPILRINIRNQSIAFALRYFLPLAYRLRKNAPSDIVTRKIFITVSNQLWSLLPNLLSTANDFEQYFPQLAEILGRTLHEQRDLRLIVLSSLRSALRYALQFDTPEMSKDLMRFFAYSFMRELFSLYTVSDSVMESVEGLAGNSLKTLRYSVLETARMYLDLTPHGVIDNFVNLAIEKVQMKEMELDQKMRVIDLMAMLVRKASVSGLSKIFAIVYPWFTCSEVAFQKKAFRILEEITKRLKDEAATDFFTSHIDELSNVMEQDIGSVAMNARAALLSIYYNKLLSLTSFEETDKFAEAFFTKIVVCFDKSHNIRTRSNALKLFVKLCEQLIFFGSTKSKSLSNVLYSVLERIFGMLNPKEELQSKDGLLEIARSTTIALNVVAQKYVRFLDSSLLSRLIAHACSWIGDGRPAVRVLVIRLLRILVKKLPDYALQQYQELLLSAIFDGQLTADVTQKVRKANRLLLEVLVDRYGAEVLLNRTDKLEWIKQLKAIAKIRYFFSIFIEQIVRRKQQRNRVQHMDEKQSDEVASMVTSARTVNADTILDILGDSDSEKEMEMEFDRQSIGGRTRGSSVWLKNDDEEDMMDLLDRNFMFKKIAISRPDSSRSLKLHDKSGEDNDGEFEVAKDGRIIVEDLDFNKRNEKKRKQFATAFDIQDKKYSGISEGGSISDKDDDDDDDNDDSHDAKTLISSKSNRPHGRAIGKDHRGNAFQPRKKMKGVGDARKKGEKFEPYVYIPISRRKGQKTLLKKLIKGSKK